MTVGIMTIGQFSKMSNCPLKGQENQSGCWFRMCRSSLWRVNLAAFVFLPLSAVSVPMFPLGGNERLNASNFPEISLESVATLAGRLKDWIK